MLEAAFDPIPSISPCPINVDRVRDWIDQAVRTKGENLLKQKSKAEIVYLS
jgi:hypothetical protein